MGSAITDITMVSRTGKTPAASPAGPRSTGTPSTHAPSIRTMASGSVPACDVGIIALPAGDHGAIARRLLAQGADVVSTADSVADVRALRSLHDEACERKRRIVIGAGFAPGLTCILARHGAGQLDTVTEIHVAKHGTGGPACARQHHAALKRPARDYRHGGWLRRPGGSGRELVWFPSPIDGADCYRAELVDPDLLVPAFPGVERVSARVAATRRDRFTSRLPMLTPPHAEGDVGAVRVEIWGTRAGEHEVQVYGASARPAAGAAVVAGTAAAMLGLADAPRASQPSLLNRFGLRHGAAGLAEWAAVGPFLRVLHQSGLGPETFEGSRSYDEGASPA